MADLLDGITCEAMLVDSAGVDAARLQRIQKHRELAHVSGDAQLAIRADAVTLAQCQAVPGCQPDCGPPGAVRTLFLVPLAGEAEGCVKRAARWLRSTLIPTLLTAGRVVGVRGRLLLRALRVL
jgi:hypothetical protein